MTKSQFIELSKKAEVLTFSKKVELNNKPITTTIEEFKDFLCFKIPNLNESLNYITSEYIHYHARSKQGKNTHYRMFADGVLIDNKKYIALH